MKMGFAEVDITPQPGQPIIGWLKEIIGHTVLDPLFVRAAVLEDAGRQIAWIAFDALSIRWTHTQEIRTRIQHQLAFPGDAIMVSATHTHAGGATCRIADAGRDEPYIQRLTAAAVDAFAAALQNLQPVELGIARKMHHALPRNRRVVMRDGTVKTHGDLNATGALFIEGPVDPELSVFFARNLAGKITGAIVNFTCHPVHHGFDGCFSAGWPGALAQLLKDQSVPVTLFLNGALGNIHHSDPSHQRPEPDKLQAGALIAADVAALLAAATDFRKTVRLQEAKTTLSLPLRTPTPEQIAGTVRGAQRFIDPAIYDRSMPRLLERIQKYAGRQLAEIQAFALDEFVFLSIPAELFVELGLAIKEKSHPRKTLIVGLANGMIGYVPTADAFARGGYETTFASSSRMAPETGDLLVQAAANLIASLNPPPPT